MTIASQKITLQPFKAREGLKAIHEFSKIIMNASPYIVLLSERPKIIRATAFAKMINEVDGFDDFIFNIVSLSTGIDRSLLETKATLKELLNAFIRIMELNDWEKYWKIAHSLKIANTDSFAAWVYSRASKIRG